VTWKAEHALTITDGDSSLAEGSLIFHPKRLRKIALHADLLSLMAFALTAAMRSSPV